MRHLTVTGTAAAAFMAATHSPTSASSAITFRSRNGMWQRSRPSYTVHLESGRLWAPRVLEAMVGGHKTLVSATVGGVSTFKEKSRRLKLTVQTPGRCDEGCED